MIPNTTQIPNDLFNGEMQKMKDTELRIVLLVARKTLGWIENIETGMRKEEDWISHYQLVEFTGRKSRALSTAIENCIKKRWIEARDNKGNILDTPQKRAGKKIFYRLGKVFLDKIETPAESAEVSQTPAKSAIVKSAIAESANNKRNTINKRNTLTKEELVFKKQIDELINLFQYINPSFTRLFGNITQRKALERLVNQHGKEKIEWAIGILDKTNKMPFSPTITTPIALENKLGDLIAFCQKEKVRIIQKKPIVAKIK